MNNIKRWKIIMSSNEFISRSKTTLLEFLTLCTLLGLYDGIASDVGSHQRSFYLEISIALCQKGKYA